MTDRKVAAPEPEPGTDAAAKMAFREIRAIMVSRGVMGLAVFQSHERCYVLRSCPAWQAVREEIVAGAVSGFRVRLKRSEEPDQGSYNAKASRTAAVVDAMFQVLSREALGYGSLRDMIDQRWDVDWQPLADYDPLRDN